MKKSEILEQAKEYIQQNGWKQIGQGPNGVTTEPYPVGGSCLMLTFLHIDHTTSEEELCGFDTYDEGAEWNDHKDRTVEDVYALLDTRIAYYKELGD